MRPQGFGQGGGSLEDLGWDDMGFEPPKAASAPRDETHDAFGEELEEQPLRNPVAALTPVQSPVHSQQKEIAGRLNVPDEDLTEEGEEIDETAELYDPEAEPAEPVTAEPETFEPETFEPEAPEAESSAPPVVVELTPARAAVARRVSVPRAAPGSKA